MTKTRTYGRRKSGERFQRDAVLTKTEESKERVEHDEHEDIIDDAVTAEGPESVNDFRAHEEAVGDETTARVHDTNLSDLEEMARTEDGDGVEGMDGFMDLTHDDNLKEADISYADKAAQDAKAEDEVDPVDVDDDDNT